VTDFLGNHPLFSFYLLKAIDFSRHNSGGVQQSLNRNFIAPILVAVPKRKEQEAITEALSDADALIDSLEQILAKKRHVKQAAMQQLLTGQTRLPGFHAEWELKPFGDTLSRLNGKAYQIQSSDYQETGDYPIVDQGKDHVIGFSDRADKKFHCPSDGVIVFGDHTCIVKFVDFDFVVGADGTQILAARNGQSARFHAYQLEHSGRLDIIGTSNFSKNGLFVAPTLGEQTAIAAILTDMDAERAALEQRLAKTRALKQGMMQELLTGKTRLISQGGAHA
jgi:type I restriction enzyme S subunit